MAPAILNQFYCSDADYEAADRAAAELARTESSKENELPSYETGILFEQASFAENGVGKAPKQSQRKRKDITDDSLQISTNVVNAQMKNTSDILRTVKASMIPLFLSGNWIRSLYKFRKQFSANLHRLPALSISVW